MGFSLLSSLLNLCPYSTLDHSRLASRVNNPGDLILLAGEEGEIVDPFHHCQLHLQLGEPHSDAGSWALAKGKEGVGTSGQSRLLGEVVRVKLSGVRIVPFITVNANLRDVYDVIRF